MRRTFALTLSLMLLAGCGLWQRETGAARVPGHPGAMGPVETLGRGEIDGQAWKLTAYRSKDGLCVDLHMGTGSGGSCGFGLLRGDLAVSGQAWSSELPDYAQIEGQVSKRVAKLTSRSGDGPEEKVALHESERFNLVFFIAFAPVEADYELIAYDNDGKVLGTEALTRSELKPEG